MKDALLHGSNLNTTECGSYIGVEFKFDAPMTCERLIMSISQRVDVVLDDKGHHCYGKTEIVFYVLVFTLMYSFEYI